MAYLILAGYVISKQNEKHYLLYSYIQTLNKNKEEEVVPTVQSQPAIPSTTYVQQPQPVYNNTSPIYVNVANTQPQSNSDHESAKQISELHEEISELKKTIESSNTKQTITTDQIEDIPAYIDISRVANEKSSTSYPI